MKILIPIALIVGLVIVNVILSRKVVDHTSVFRKEDKLAIAAALIVLAVVTAFIR